MPGSPAEVLPPRRFGRWDGSASKIKRYESCPLSFRFRYVDGVPDPAGHEARVGTLVHGALERACRARIGVPAPGSPAELPELLELLGEEAPGVDHVDEEDLKAAKDLLEQLAPFDLQAGGVILEVEGSFGVKVGRHAKTGEAIVFGGFEDLVRRRADGVIEGVDWKSGQGQSRADAEVDPQVGLYLADLHERFPGEEVVLTLVYLAAGFSVTVEWSEEIEAMARGQALASYLAWERGRFPARVNPPHCRNCFARDLCGPYREWLEELEVYDPEGPVKASALPFPELLRQRHNFADVANAAEKRRRDLDKELQRRLENVDAKTIDVDGEWKVGLRSRRSGKLDVALLPELSAHLGIDPYEVLRKAGAVSATGVKKLVKDDDAAKRLVERYRDPKSSTHVEVRRIEKKDL